MIFDETIKLFNDKNSVLFDLTAVKNVLKERTKKKSMRFLIKNIDKKGILSKYNDTLQPFLQIL